MFTFHNTARRSLSSKLIQSEQEKNHEHEFSKKYDSIFLRTRLPGDPFRDSALLDKTKKELGELIKKRGVNFRYETLSDFGNEIGKFGMTSEVTFPLRDNYGPPTKQEWYIGTWSTSVTSVNGWWNIAAKTGFLTINADGTYVWKLSAGDPPANYVRGAWRKATKKEMDVSYQGGSGIVLLSAKQGYDFIVRQDRVTTLAGDWIDISDLGTRQMREGGKRR
jgi:hypothetical protein